MNKVFLIIIALAFLALYGFLIYLFVRRTDNYKEKKFLFNSVFLYILLFVILQPLLLDINTTNIITNANIFLGLFLYTYWFLSVSTLINQFAPIPGIVIFSDTPMSTRNVK